LLTNVSIIRHHLIERQTYLILLASSACNTVDLACITCNTVDLASITCNTVDLACITCNTVDLACITCSTVDLACITYNTVDLACITCNTVNLACIMCIYVDLSRAAVSVCFVLPGVVLNHYLPVFLCVLFTSSIPCTVVFHEHLFVWIP